VGSILKALGLTIWGLIACGLLAVLIFVGYEAALRYRASSGPIVEHSATNQQPKQSQHGSSGDDLPIAPVARRAEDATRELFLSAAQNNRSDLVIGYGQQLVDERSAEPADLSIIAQSYSSVGDCANAQIWAQQAKEALQAAKLPPDESLRRIIACCEADRDKPRIVSDSAHSARLDQLLSKTEAAKADSGAPFVRLGELYYGFGQYELAIASIQRGLNKGQIAHLDEAYVYLGLSEQAVGDLGEARSAFGKLKDVPGISPRVLRLWTLYAQTQLVTSKVQSATDDGECRKNTASGS
jgi:tetratricopeptide (TPR) repeat protein